MSIWPTRSEPTAERTDALICHKGWGAAEPVCLVHLAKPSASQTHPQTPCLRQNEEAVGDENVVES